VLWFATWSQAAIQHRVSGLIDWRMARTPVVQQSLGFYFVDVRHWWFRKPGYSSSLRRLCERLLHEEA
jgi:hypothetical protein